MTPVNDLETPAAGTPIDPELLSVIQRVAHRTHLLDPAPQIHSTATTRSARRRPASAVARHTRPTRGTTARKVTWS